MFNEVPVPVGGGTDDMWHPSWSNGPFHCFIYKLLTVKH